MKDQKIQVVWALVALVCYERHPILQSTTWKNECLLRKDLYFQQYFCVINEYVHK